MASSKSKKKASPTQDVPKYREQLADLAPLPIADFDEIAFQATCQQLSIVGKALIKSLTSILAATEDVPNGLALKILSASPEGQRLPDLVSEAEEAFKSSTAVLPMLRSQLDQWRSGERRTRRARFEQIVGKIGWKVVGSWPEPVVEGIVFLAIDEGKDRAVVNGRSIVSPTAERLAVQVADELEELVTRRADPSEFIRQLWKGYVVRGGVPGQGVSVYDLLAEITWQKQSKAFQRDPRQEAFRGYSLAQFRADLTHYLTSGAQPFNDAGKSYELEIVGGSFAQDGIFMYFPQTDRLATFGRLTFRLSAAGDKP